MIARLFFFLQVYELQQEFGGADFVTASRIFIREGDLSKVSTRYPLHRNADSLAKPYSLAVKLTVSPNLTSLPNRSVSPYLACASFCRRVSGLSRGMDDIAWDFALCPGRLCERANWGKTGEGERGRR